MPWYCSICTDIFNGIKIISTTPCGHIFHLDCLKKWITQSGTCPECRQTVSSHRLVKLHPNEISCTETQSNENYFALKAELNEKDGELRKLRDQNEELTIYVAKAESEASAYFQEKCKLEFQLKDSNLQKKFIKSLESKLEKLEKINRQLNYENEHLNGVKTIVNGTQSEAEEVLSSYSSNTNEEDAAKKLATYCSILKRELDRIIQEKKVLKSELLQLKNRCTNNSSNVVHLQNLVEKLKKDISVLEKEKRDSSFQYHPKDISSCDSEQSIKVGNIITGDDVDYSPITVKFSENKKKIGVRIMEDELPTSSKLSTFSNKKVEFASSLAVNCEEESITRIGYDGLGGHSSIVNKSCNRNIPKQLIGRKTNSNRCKLVSPLSKRKRNL